MTSQNLLLLHGALGSKDQLLKLKDYLSPHFNLHMLNFEGHGGRSSNRIFSTTNFTENVHAYLLENNLDKISIFGYSMGGYVALNFAKHYANMVEAIITLGTKVNWDKEAAAKEVKMLNPDVIERKVPKFASHLQQTHAPNDWKEVLHKTAGMMLGLGNGHALIKEDFQKIQHKILVGIGTGDNMVTMEESQFLAEHLPNGTLKAIEDFQHPIARNDMKVLSDIIKDFLN